MPRSRKRKSLTIDDPKALRALAHPVRQRVILDLYAGEVLTATEAAKLCGITPSAMSYHLRALERWGIVERDESSDGRERPWRAVADHFSIPASAHRAAGAAVSRTFMEPWAEELRAGLERAADDAAAGGPGELTTLSRGRIWLTAAEAKRLDRDLRALIKPYQARTSRAHPHGAVCRDAYWLLLPPPG